MEEVSNQARAALLRGDARGFCALLTPHGRARSLQFKVDFGDEGSVPSGSPRLPQTCEQVVKRESAIANDPRVDVTWADDLRRADLRVRDVKEKSATIDIAVPGAGNPVPSVTAVKTAAGWRLDDGNGTTIPSGH